MSSNSFRARESCCVRLPFLRTKEPPVGGFLTSAQKTQIGVCAHVCVRTCFKGKLDFSIEAPAVNQCCALCPALPHPSVKPQNSETENNLHIIFGVFLSWYHSVLCTVLLRFSNLFLNSLWIWLLLLPLGYYSTI